MTHTGQADQVPVAYVITSLSMGGAQKVLLGLLASGLSQRYPPLVISLRHTPGLEAAFRGLGVEPFYVGLEQPWRVLGNIRRLLALLKAHDVRLLYSLMHHANLFAVLLRYLLGKPRPALVWSLHDTPVKNLYTRWSHRFFLWLTCRLSHIPERIVLVSERSRARYLELGYPAASTTLIPNGVDVPTLEPDRIIANRHAVRTELGLSPASLLVGSLTRAVPEKDLPCMLEAFALLAPDMPNLHLLLAGEGVDAENSDLVQQVNQHGLAGRVHLLGVRSDAKRLIRALDVATLSSRSEAFPLFIAEAMALGIPCVATDVGDIAHLLGGHGLLVPAGDAAPLATAWRQVLHWSSSQRSAWVNAAWERVNSQFSLQQMVKRHAALFAELGW